MIFKFPTSWKPYPFQVPLWNYLLGGGKRAVAVWHRRAGKDVLGINWITAAALREVGIYWYVYPTYTQARISVWDGLTLDGRTYLSFIPEGLIKEKSKGSSSITLTNGSIIQFVGSDRHEDNLRGGGARGAVLSEYSIQNPKAMTSIIEPMLIRAKGWALYLYTPSSKVEETHGKELYDKAKRTKHMFCDFRTINDTTDHNGEPLVLEESLKKESSMDEEQIQREFYCNFKAYKHALVRERAGNFFAHELSVARIAGRVGFFPHDAAYPVDTYWDIGVVDFTTIWFVQEKPNEIVIIDFYYNRGKTIDFYLNVLRSRGNYHFAKNVLPHDMNRRDIISADTRWTKANEIADKLCFPPFILGSKYTVVERLEEARKFLAKCRIDEKRCFRGLEGLADYSPAKRKRPGSHSSLETDIVDSFSYMAMQVKTREERRQEYKVFDTFPSNLKTIDDSNPFNF
ncbi:MAG: hypothetical protein GY858_01135 [Candidatus Omnitrophica bacterium]|nr:hypothetical protein [Candidatus Omnitrophota bacterium]